MRFNQNEFPISTFSRGSIFHHVCYQQKDIFTKKSSQPEKKQKYLHQSNRCQQLWDSSWSAKEKVTNGMLLQHNRVQNYLGIAPSVQINFKCVYNQNQHIILKDKQAINNTKVHNELSAQNAALGQHSTSEPPEKVSCHNKLPNNNQRHTDPPSGHQRATTQLPPFPPFVYAALSQLTDADSKAIQASSTLTECVKTLVFLASYKDKQLHLDKNSHKTTVITEPLSNRFQLSNSNPVVSPPSKLFENAS